MQPRPGPYSHLRVIIVAVRYLYQNALGSVVHAGIHHGIPQDEKCI